MIPDLCLIVGYVSSALVLTVQADGLTDGSTLQTPDIITPVVVAECLCLGFVMLAGAFTMYPTKSTKNERLVNSMMSDNCETEALIDTPASSTEVGNATGTSSYEVESFSEPPEQLQSPSRDEKTDILASQYVNVTELRLQDGTRVVFVALQSHGTMEVVLHI